MRKIIGSIALLSFLAAYITIAVLIGEKLQGMKVVSIFYYVVAGIAWALPLKPLLRWMHAKDKPLPAADI